MLPLVALAPLALVSMVASAPCDQLDLPTALALATQRSEEVVAAEAAVVTAEADQALAQAAGIIPIASATVVGGPSPEAHGNAVVFTGASNRSLEGLSVFGRLDANVVQPIWTWGQLSAARDAAQAGVTARERLVNAKVAEIQERVVELFWAHALAQRLLALAAEVDKALTQAETKINEALQDPGSSGDISTEDKYRVALFRSQLEQRRSQAQQALDLSVVGMAATLAYPAEKLSLKDVVLDATPSEVAPVAVLTAAAESQRPDLAALDQGIRAKSDEVKATRAARLPQFFAAGTFTFAYAPNRDLQLDPWIEDPFRQVSGGVVVGFRQDLSFWMFNARVQKSEAGLVELTDQRAELVRLIDVQVAQARAEAMGARERWEAARKSVSAGKSWFRTAALNFGMGVDDAKTMLEAYSGYVESQIGLASAAHDVLVSAARLNQLTGTPVVQGQSPCELP